MPGTVPATEPTAFQGPVRSLGQETDGSLFGSGWSFAFDVGTWTFTRGAVGNYFMRKTAAANTPKAIIPLDELWMRKVGTDPELAALTGQVAATKKRPPHLIRGFQVTTMSLIYAIGTANLNSHAAVLKTTLYANNAAPVVTDQPVTGALATTTQAQPY